MLITTDKEELSVIMHGREQFWSLRARVRVPKSTIQDMRFETVFNDWRKWEIRMPGASIPGHLVAGSYWTEEGWDFLYIIDPRGFVKPKADNVLVIETDQDKYKRLIVSCDAKQATKLIQWWKR
jgi:hypothetical protein